MLLIKKHINLNWNFTNQCFDSWCGSSQKQCNLEKFFYQPLVMYSLADRAFSNDLLESLHTFLGVISSGFVQQATSTIKIVFLPESILTRF